MKVYIAGTWEEKDFVKRLIDGMRGEGHEVFDWTAHHDPMKGKEYAEADEKAVRECDVFVLTHPETISRGKFTEYGMALALHKKIVIMGDTYTLGIFGRLGRYVRAEDAEELASIIFAMST